MRPPWLDSCGQDESGDELVALKIINTPSGYIAEDEELYIKLSNLQQDGDGIKAVLSVRVKSPIPKSLGIYRLNLLSPQSRSSVSRALAKRYPLDGIGDPWNEIIERVAEECSVHFMSPLEPQVIEPTESSSPRWLIENLVLAESPNLFYGFGGTGKSLLALFIALCVQNGITFFGKTEQAKTLLLDYETDLDEMRRRTTLLLKELDMRLMTPHYIRAHTPLPDMLDALIDICTGHGFRFVVIDSAVCAVGDDLNASQAVARFFAAVRKLNACGVTVLIISHVAKKERESSERTPFGSVYFLNFPRVAWEIQGDWDNDDHSLRLALFCRKSNVGPLKPIGVQMMFTKEGIAVFPADPEGVSGGKETAINLILDLLRRKPMKPKEIAKELELPSGTVWNALYRLKVRGKIEQDEDGVWRAIVPTPVPF